jgi:hypothetical protein
MDTDSVGYNLSRDQFGYAYFRDHHERLNLAEPQVGAILGMFHDDPESAVRPTRRRATFGAQEPLIPNQTHVNVDKVEHYVKHPSSKPIFVVKNPATGENHVLDGHHRLVANRLRGVPTKAQYYEVK